MGFTRYQIAIKNALKLKPTAYRFEPTNSIRRTCDYLKRCIVDEVMFDASNILLPLLDSALVKLCQEFQSSISIITKSEASARILSITKGFKRVYSVDNIPNTANTVICYWDLDRRKIPEDLHVILVLLREK
jgi:hypothetical protein